MEQSKLGTEEVIIDMKQTNHQRESQSAMPTLIRKDLTPIKDFGSDYEAEDGIPPESDVKGQHGIEEEEEKEESRVFEAEEKLEPEVE